MTDLTGKSLVRVQALALLVRNHGQHIEGYKGDLCYDGALLALNDGTVLSVLHNFGSHLIFDDKLAAALTTSYGPSERAKWFLGTATIAEDGTYTFAFRATTPAEAIDALQAANVEASS